MSYYWRHQFVPYNNNNGLEREACNVFFVWEMLRPLLAGATLYIIPDTVIYDPRLLVAFLAEHAITRSLFTPSLLDAVLLDTTSTTEGADASLAVRLASLSTVWLCGEVVTGELRARLVAQLPHVRLLNLYSISEAHDVSASDLTHLGATSAARKYMPAGFLLPNVRIHVLTTDLQPLPIGVPGEIYVAGPTLAIGYLNRPDLTQQRFIQSPSHLNPNSADPSSSSVRLYKTGDWGCLLSDGQLEIMGRCDGMVKIRGYSVEVRAIEATLTQVCA